MPAWAENGVMVAFMGAFMFGLVYVPIVALGLWLLRRQSWAMHARVAAVLPVGWVLTIGAITPAMMPEATASEAMALWGPYCLGLGYFYVVLAFAGMWLVDRLGAFHSERAG